MAKKDKPSRALSRPRKPPAGSHLSEEEHALWEWAARDLKPLKTKSGRVRDTERDEPEPVPRAHRDEADNRDAGHGHGGHAHKHGHGGQGAKGVSGQPTAPKAEKSRSVPPLSDLDRRKTRKVGAGRVDIEARIDLHGMRQSEAHMALRRFLLRAHADGKRWVLVITGKGTMAREREASELDGYSTPERGVLRRNVPHWLAEPELRAIVVGFTAAAVRHGGDGALYVQLRRRERTR